MSEPTIQDLKLLARGSVPLETTLALLMASSANDILATIDPAIDYIVQEFARNPKERQGRNEDALSIDLVTSLRDLGFHASHDQSVGGHCDIVIEGRYNFLWLGEAKKHRGNKWLLKGFHQLDSRYATALKGQDYGGIIIYHFGSRSDRVMDSWADFLDKSLPHVDVLTREAGALCMNTRHVHKRTGRQYHIRHVIVPLHWDPEV